MKQATFYHAGCPVCVNAEKSVADGLDPKKFNLKSIHLGEEKKEVSTAENLGVQSVPALVIEGQVFHINHGADLEALKN